MVASLVEVHSAIAGLIDVKEIVLSVKMELSGEVNPISLHSHPMNLKLPDK